MQYDKISAAAVKNEVTQISTSSATQAAINKVLRLDTLVKHDKDVVIASGTYSDVQGTLDLTQDLKGVKGEKAVMLNITASGNDPVTLTLGNTTAKTFAFNSDADLAAAFKTSGSVIVSGTGSDNLTIKGFKNFVEAGAGDDTITTAYGNDTVNGGDGKDELHGGNGNDTLSGDAGDDKLYGDNGNDKLYGGEGNDTLEGGNGRDYLNGGNGDDLLKGGNGNDTLEGGIGNDTLEGGNGTDTYVWSSSDVNSGAVNATLLDDKGSKLVIDFSGLKVDGDTLNDLSKGKVEVGSILDENNNIAFLANENGDGGVLQVDTTGDHTADFQITIVGSVTGVEFNAHSDTFNLV